TAATLGTTSLPVDAVWAAGQRARPSIDESQDPRRGRGPQHVPLALAYGDIRRHFIFEYYPWYGVGPYRHWEQWDRVPPTDLASHYVPRLGAYDSRSTTLLEQHARWI